LTLEDGTW